MDEFDKIKKEVENPLKSVFLKDRKKGLYEIALSLISKYNFKTIAGEKNDELYIYDKGIYLREKGAGVIKTEVQKILEELCSTFYVNEAIGHIKRKTFTDRGEFEKEPVNLACLNNGILNFETGELMPHSPEHIFLAKIPVNYDAETDCPEIKKFLKDVFYEEDVPVIEEWMGYALFRKYFIKKAMILEGYKDTGKTTFLNLFTKFIGKENLSEVSLQKLTKDRFASAYLFGKHLNLYDDLDVEDIRNSGILKIATGGGRMPAEYKFLDHFHFENFAKLTFATNQIPSVKDDSDDAYFSRWIIIKTDNVFDESNPKRDPEVIKKLTTEQELSGLLNCALEGLKRLLKNGSFSYYKTLGEIKDIMQRSSSSLSAFVQDRLVKRDGGWISKEDLYNAYVQYTAEREMASLTKERVGRDLRKFAYYIVDSKGKDSEGKEVRGWRNVDFKEKRKEEILQELF